MQRLQACLVIEAGIHTVTMKNRSSLVITAVGIATNLRPISTGETGAVANQVAENVSEGQLPPHHQWWWKHNITVMKCQGGHGSEPHVVRENNVCSIGCAACVCQHVKWGNKSKCFTQCETKGMQAGMFTQTGNYYAKTNDFLFWQPAFVLTMAFCLAISLGVQSCLKEGLTTSQ